MSASRRRRAVLAALVLLSALDVGLVLGRFHETGTHTYSFLIWNLVLAWVPLGLALAVYDAYRRRGLRLRLALPAVAWLVFLPNAPYVVTDFVHLRTIRGMPLWFDAAMLASFAVTALVLGFVSLALVHAVVQREAGRLAAWWFAGGTLALASVGIYLGRFLRFNSWEVVTSPGRLLETALIRLRDPLGNPRLLALVAIFTAFLAVGYVLVWALAQPAVELESSRRGARQ